MTIEEATGLLHGDRVQVRTGTRWQNTVIDSAGPTNPRHGWITVAGWPDRAGPVSVHVDDIRRPQ